MIHKKYKKIGSLEVICGPMFSGKSEELIRRLRRATIAQQRVAVFKHAIDNRYNQTSITSHNGTTLNAHATNQSSHILAIAQKEDYTVVGIDEIQFYTTDIIETICTLINARIRVIVAGLDLDHRGIPFGPTPTLLALADSITKLRAICTMCGDEAHFSQLLTPQNTKDIIVVGGAEKYVARCRDCYVTPQPQSHNQAELQ
jgi:thymidine kinase